MRIEIEISHLATFAKVAYILDQQIVIDRINEIRKYWNIVDLVSYDQFDNWIKKPHIDFVLSPKAAEALNDSTERFETDVRQKQLTAKEELSKTEDLSQVRVIDYELEYTLRVIGLDMSLKAILLKAVVCGKVKDGDVNMRSDQMGKYSQWLFSDKTAWGKIAYTGDTKDDIRRDREWYWSHKTGKSYLQITKEFEGRGAVDPYLFRENVKRQVKRYEKFLGGNI